MDGPITIPHLEPSAQVELKSVGIIIYYNACKTYLEPLYVHIHLSSKKVLRSAKNVTSLGLILSDSVIGPN